MIKSAIKLNQLKLMVQLGWPDAERMSLQPIFVDFKIRFLNVPNACQTDVLDDTFCYDSLVTFFKTEVAKRQFRLIEHLGAYLYQLAKNRLTEHAITICLTKQPPIADLTNGVSFYYGDDEW